MWLLLLFACTHTLHHHYSYLSCRWITSAHTQQFEDYSIKTAAQSGSERVRQVEEEGEEVRRVRRHMKAGRVRFPWGRERGHPPQVQMNNTIILQGSVMKHSDSHRTHIRAQTQTIIDNTNRWLSGGQRSSHGQCDELYRKKFNLLFGVNSFNNTDSACCCSVVNRTNRTNLNYTSISEMKIMFKLLQSHTQPEGLQLPGCISP